MTQWTPDQFWEYVGGLVGDFERVHMRDMMEEHGLSVLPQSPKEHGCWSDEDYNRARDCMIGILRGHAWTIADGGRGCQEFDNAFQHAVGILALTVSRPDGNSK